MNTKPTNPKDAIGSRKARSWQSLSWNVIREVSIAFLEGAMRYGRHNYRPAGVRASVYFDAANDHMKRWWEGEDLDPDVKFTLDDGRVVGLSHITKAICCLIVLRDSMLTGNWVDDRPPHSIRVEEHVEELQRIVDKLFEKYPDPKPPFTNSGEW